MIIEETIKRFICDKCGHSWTNKTGEVPVICPRCKTRKWNDGKTDIEGKVKKGKVELDWGEKEDEIEVVEKDLEKIEDFDFGA